MDPISPLNLDPPFSLLPTGLGSIDQATIYLAFRNHLLDMDGAPDPGAEIAWENVAFSPPAGTLWLRERMVWINEVLRPLDTLEANATMDYDIFVPDMNSIEAAQAMAKKLSQRFTPSVPASLPIAPPIRVSILKSEILTGRPTDVNSQRWYQLPFKMTFRAWGPAAS